MRTKHTQTHTQRERVHMWMSEKEISGSCTLSLFVCVFSALLLERDIHTPTLIEGKSVCCLEKKLYILIPIMYHVLKCVHTDTESMFCI